MNLWIFIRTFFINIIQYITRYMSHYEGFKQEVIRELTKNYTEDIIIEHALPHFEDLIDSNRMYQQIKISKSLQKLFEVLEHRDELSENNIKPIKDLARLLNCVAAETQIINQYEKLVSQTEHCSQCGENYHSEDRQIEPLPIPKISPLKSFIGDNSDSESEDETLDIDDAIKKIAPRVGKTWTNVARKLKMRECEINALDEKEPNLNAKIDQMFKIWKENSKRPTVVRLKRALEKCRQDLAKML